jgi:hypothetical protein
LAQFKTCNTLVQIAAVTTRLYEFSIIDDVDATGDLPLDNLGYRVRQTGLECVPR